MRLTFSSSQLVGIYALSLLLHHHTQIQSFLHSYTKPCFWSFGPVRLKGFLSVCLLVWSELQPPYKTETHPVLFPSFSVTPLWFPTAFVYTQLPSCCYFCILFIVYSCFLQRDMYNKSYQATPEAELLHYKLWSHIKFAGYIYTVGMVCKSSTESEGKYCSCLIIRDLSKRNFASFAPFLSWIFTDCLLGSLYKLRIANLCHICYKHIFLICDLLCL